MEIKRILCGLLAGLMLLTCIGCGNGEDVTDETQPDAAKTEEIETELKDNVPELNYNDDEVTILSRYREGWTSGEIAVEGLNKDPVNDAVYERNKTVEDRLGLKIISQEEHNDDQALVITMIKNDVSSGAGEYDLLAAACYVTLNESLNGTFADLRQTEYVDFDKPWWSQGFNSAVEYKGAQFAVTGAAVLSMYRFAFATLFNKRLFKEANVPNLYDNVRDGTWTLDYQISIVSSFHRDDGNGKQDATGDVYGLITTDYISTDPYWSSCQVPILTKDEYGDYTLENFDSARLSDVCDKLILLYYGSDGATYDIAHYGADQEQDDIRDMFSEGWGAMATLRLMALENASMRDMVDEYGVVPMPKFDEVQKDYQTLLHDQFTVLAVPTTVRDDRLTEVSALMEVLCYQSYKTVKPAYYDVALRSKYMKDPDSAEMLDLLINNIYIDPGIIYTNALSTFHDGLRQIMGSKKNTVVSKYKSTLKSATKALKKMCDKLDKLIG
ncbi:MAG: hypothetical protein MJ192_02135 [Clostridia bacterium]|nr:hypothetical protein [Clostridia bacterium]